MCCPKDTASDNSILRANAFINKSFSSGEACYGNIEKEAKGIIHGIHKFHHYCLPERYDYRAQTIGTIFRKDVATPITEVSAYPAEETAVQNTHNLQTRNKPVHSCLAIKAILCREQGWRNIWPTVRHKCHQCSSRCLYVHDNIKDMRQYTAWYSPMRPKLCYKRLAIKQGIFKARCMTLLDIQR